jgi:hypothetical protein
VAQNSIIEGRMWAVAVALTRQGTPRGHWGVDLLSLRLNNSTLALATSADAPGRPPATRPPPTLFLDDAVRAANRSQRHADDRAL